MFSSPCTFRFPQLFWLNPEPAKTPRTGAAPPLYAATRLALDKGASESAPRNARFSRMMSLPASASAPRRNMINQPPEEAASPRATYDEARLPSEPAPPSAAASGRRFPSAETAEGSAVERDPALLPGGVAEEEAELP